MQSSGDNLDASMQINEDLADLDHHLDDHIDPQRVELKKNLIRQNDHRISLSRAKDSLNSLEKKLESQRIGQSKSKSVFDINTASKFETETAQAEATTNELRNSN